MSGISRRRFLAATAAVGVVAGFSTPASARTTAARAMAIDGTTLQSVAAPIGAAGYRKLTDGPGWPLVVRTDLAAGSPGRDDRRRPVTSFVQLTDLHVCDAQSPMRFEYAYPYFGGAFRPHETLSALGAASLVERVNSLSGGPFTGRRFDFVMNTGDSTDNNEVIELDWYLDILNGGTVTPDSGAPGRYEGVQNSGLSLYWNPESAGPDKFKQAGFGQLPGFLSAAIRSFHSPGLSVPWFATFGNHDDSVVGAVPDLPVLLAIYTGAVKVQGVSDATAQKLASKMRTNPNEAADLLASLTGIVRIVTPDLRRRPFTAGQFVRAHLDPANTGPGPVGHGFSTANLGNDVYYAFPMAAGVTGISLDTTNRAGLSDGSLNAGQLHWLENVLKSKSSRYYDTDGTLVRQQVTDELLVLFSHHTSTTMGNLLPDPTHLLERRYDGPALVALLQRFPNVVAWVNGHTHRNAITAHPGSTPDRGFWEINTASHVDYPQHARIVELADNADGTLSVFTTLIESAAGYSTSANDLSQAGLASWYRELAFNDISGDLSRVGSANDHNTELLLPNPLGSAV
ncbi:TIGR03767 family metallophosphoesterase [Fodinicola feengrottensis]|uniref:TIGR03767 family metallophosphoesterase n=1 Tax=Fodinicola feengrottensis TaxID=435914 RepID=A0ABN2G9W5_9ACTN